MAARVTDREKKMIIADWIEMQTYSAVARKHGVTHQTVKRIVNASPDIAKKVQQKKRREHRRYDSVYGIAKTGDARSDHVASESADRPGEDFSRNLEPGCNIFRNYRG